MFPSLSLHVFPTAALTSSNTLRRLTNSSLSTKWGGLKNPQGPSRDLGCRFKRRETENVCNYLALLHLAISEKQNHQEKRKNVEAGFGFLVSSSIQPGIHCEQKLRFRPHCNPSFRPLPLLISQSRRRQHSRCRISCLPIKRQACQLSLTVAEWSQTRGKDSPVIK